MSDEDTHHSSLTRNPNPGKKSGVQLWPRERLIAILRIVATQDIFDPVDTLGMKRMAQQAVEGAEADDD